MEFATHLMQNDDFAVVFHARSSSFFSALPSDSRLDYALVDVALHLLSIACYHEHARGDHKS